MLHLAHIISMVTHDRTVTVHHLVQVINKWMCMVVVCVHAIGNTHNSNILLQSTLKYCQLLED